MTRLLNFFSKYKYALRNLPSFAVAASISTLYAAISMTSWILTKHGLMSFNGEASETLFNTSLGILLCGFGALFLKKDRRISMSISASIAQNHHGWLKFDRMAATTRFVLCLPLSKSVVPVREAV